MKLMTEYQQTYGKRLDATVYSLSEAVNIQVYALS